MFIGNQFLNNNDVFDFEEKFSFEISLALYQKLKHKSYEMVYENGKFGISNKSNSIFFPYTYGYKENENLIFFSNPDEALKKLNRDIDQKKLSSALLFLQDFHNLKFSKIFKDKHGHDFKLDFIENYELNFDSLHTHNMLIVTRNNQKIGYLHSVYMDKDNIQKNFKSLSEYLLFKKNRYPKDFQELKNLSQDMLNINNIPENFNEEQYIAHTNKLLKRYTVMNNIREHKLFSNLATTYYSRLLEEEQGKGIAQIMYLETAKYYNSIGVDFRSSVALSEDSKKLWRNLQKNFPDQISTKKINDQEVFIFNPHNYDFSLEKKQIIRKTKI